MWGRSFQDRFFDRSHIPPRKNLPPAPFADRAGPIGYPGWSVPAVDPFHCTVAPDRKFAPLTVRAKAGKPIVTISGFTPDAVGDRGLYRALTVAVAVPTR